MAENDGSEEFVDENGDPIRNSNIREALKRGEKSERELKARDQELAALKRDSAFDKAGIPEEGVGELFRRSYDGPLDKAAIVQKATEYGILQVQETGSEAELAALKAAHEASAEGGATDVEDVGAKFLKDLDAAKSPEEIMELVKAADPSIGVSVPQ